jgi:uncharacterized membrane protein
MARKRQPAPRHKLYDRFKPAFSGLAGGLIFYCFSFTPSLLARGYVLQGVCSGLSFATGYGLAVAAAFWLHRLPERYRPALSARAKKITIIFLLFLAVVFMGFGYHWQQEIRRITDAPQVSGLYFIPTILIAAILSILILWAGRGCRHLGQKIGRRLQPHMRPQAARYGGGILAALLLIFIINGILFRSLFGIINYTFGLANKGTPAGVYQPQNSIYSGSPKSDIDWNSLGEKGREFVAGAPSQANVAKFSGPAAVQPSRLYAGLESAPTLQERVNLLVKELNRTGAGNRRAVLIAIPTGSGGVNDKSVQTVEYLYGGDTAALAIQYSYLPSWLSFLADQDTARENGRVLVEAVYEWWSHLDTARRPQLLMYGESLGSLGADGAFSSAGDMHARMSGVLLAGPPHANQLWQGIVKAREPGSRLVLPVYQQGAWVRFSDGQTPFSDMPKGTMWEPGRSGFLQNGSDPVVWGSLSLFIHKPDWLREPRASDVLPNMRWYPFVTGWQVALDLPFAFGASQGHGHRYGIDMPTAWPAVLNMQLTPAQSAQLAKIIGDVKG